MSDCFRPDHPTIEERRLMEDIATVTAINADQHDEIKRLRARITELERELNPDPEAHLMGWEGDDE